MQPVPILLRRTPTAGAGTALPAGCKQKSAAMAASRNGPGRSSCTCVVGLQWGDEAKGKIVDLIAKDHDFVVRYNGGANAGHTVVHEGKTFKFSLLPTGILRPNVTSVIANGVVFYPPRFVEEVNDLRAAGVPIGDNLVVSSHAHVIFPYHQEEERLNEVGTTIGVCTPAARQAATPSRTLAAGPNSVLSASHLSVRYFGTSSRRPSRIAVSMASISSM